MKQDSEEPPFFAVLPIKLLDSDGKSCHDSSKWKMYPCATTGDMLVNTIFMLFLIS